MTCRDAMLAVGVRTAAAADRTDRTVVAVVVVAFAGIVAAVAWYTAEVAEVAEAAALAAVAASGFAPKDSKLLSQRTAVVGAGIEHVVADWAAVATAAGWVVEAPKRSPTAVHISVAVMQQMTAEGHSAAMTFQRDCSIAAPVQFVEPTDLLVTRSVSASAAVAA